MKLRASAVIGLAGAAVLVPGALAAAPPLAARLDGRFLLTGKVTTARNVPGEHLGQIVGRTWTFSALCAAGPCPRVLLVRQRANAADTLVLAQQKPTHYVGTGVFVAPLRCAQRIYPAGERVPFTITVTVTGAAVINGAIVASSVNASYLSRSRTNLTPCVTGSLGHDAARYTGHLLLPSTPPPTANGRSLAGS